jgi:hypothetical protein
LKKEFSKFHKTIVDNTISNAELYQEWISLNNDDKIQKVISSTNDQIMDFNNKNNLDKEYFKFWEVIYKSVSEISNFSVKQYND